MTRDDSLSIEQIARYAIKKRIPFQVTIELLNMCNFRCIHCYLPEHNCKGLEFDTVMDIFRQLRELGTFRINLTGGEIFLRKDIMEIIRIAREMGFSVTLLSNASLITDDIAKELAELHIAGFSTTVFSLDEHLNDTITATTNSLSAVMNGANLLKQYGVPVQIKTPLMKMNKFEYRQLIPFCKEHGFQYSSSPVILSKTDGDKSPTSLRMDNSDLLTVLVEAGEDYSREEYDESELPCPSIRNTLSIDCFGNVFPCNSFYYKVGNIYENNLAYIWNESEAYKRLNAITNADLTQCKKCDIKEFCERCPGKALSEDGDLLGCSSMDRCTALLAKKIYESKQNGCGVRP